MNNDSKELARARVLTLARFMRIVCKVMMIFMIAVTSVSAILTVILLAVPDAFLSYTVKQGYEVSIQTDRLIDSESEIGKKTIDNLIESMKNAGFSNVEKTDGGYTFSTGVGSSEMTLRKTATYLIPNIIQFVVIAILMFFLSAFFADLCSAGRVFDRGAAKDLRIVSYVTWGYVAVKAVCSLFGSVSVSVVEVIFAALLTFFMLIYTTCSAYTETSEDARDGGENKQ